MIKVKPRIFKSALILGFFLILSGQASLVAAPSTVPTQDDWKVYKKQDFHFEFKAPAGSFGDENIDATPGWFIASGAFADILVMPEKETVDRAGARVHSASAVFYAEILINDAVKYDNEKDDQFVKAIIENISVKDGEGLKLTIVYDFGNAPCVSQPDEEPCPSSVETYYIFYKAPYVYQFSLHDGADSKTMDSIASTFTFLS